MSSLDRANIIPIQSEDVCNYEKIAIPFIRLALEHTDGEQSLQDVLTDIANREKQLWMIEYQNEYIAAVVTMIFTTRTGLKIGEITLAGGRDHDLWSFFPEVVGRWFKEQGCKFIDIVGRKGWARKYRNDGFREQYLVLRKDL